MFGGHAYLRRTTGLTYAEYVHQGFGQLTVATLLTLAVVVVAARKAPRDARRPAAGCGRSLGAALPAHAGRRGVGAVPDARLRAGLRLHPAAAAGRRVRGLAGLVVLLVLGAGVRPRRVVVPRAALLSGAVLAARRWRPPTRTRGSPGTTSTGSRDRQGRHRLPRRAVRRRLPALTGPGPCGTPGSSSRRSGTTTGWSGTWAGIAAADALRSDVPGCASVASGG